MIFDNQSNLETSDVLLRPLKEYDFIDLSKVANDFDTWKWFNEDLSQKEFLKTWVNWTYLVGQRISFKRVKQASKVSNIKLRFRGIENETSGIENRCY